MLKLLGSLIPALGLFLATGQPVAAATPSPESTAIVSIAKDLLSKGRALIVGYRSFYKDLEAHPERYDQVRLGIVSDREAAQSAKDARALDLLAAIQVKVELLTLELVIPYIVEFHQGMLGLVGDYKSQACAPGGNPALCIGGLWSKRRVAMGNIIDSEASDIQAIESVSDHASSTLDLIASEFENISLLPGATEYGLAHYLNKKAVTLQSLYNTVSDIAPMFNGRDLQNQTVQRYLPCLIGVQIPLSSLKTELNGLRSAASAYSNDHEAWLAYVQSLEKVYDGDGDNPGILAHWQGCVSSKNIQINTLTAAIAQALSDGDLTRASNFDRDRHGFQEDIAKLQSEIAILQLRRSQIAEIASTESAFYDSEHPEDTTWVVSAIAHIDDLLRGMNSYPPALRAIRAIVSEAQSHLGDISPNSDATALHDDAATVAARFRTDIARGLDKIKSEIGFIGRTVLPGLAQAIRIGESALTANIATYEDILQQAFDAAHGEQVGLPARLAQANQAIAVAQQNFDNADQFVRDEDALLARHDAAVVAIAAARSTLEPVLGVARFNPLYTDLSAAFLTPLRTDRAFRKAGVQAQSSIRSYLKNFNGLGSGGATGFRCKNRKGACSSAFVRKAAKLRDQMVTAIGPQMDIIGRPYLGGQNISDLVNNIVQNNAIALIRG